MSKADANKHIPKYRIGQNVRVNFSDVDGQIVKITISPPVSNGYRYLMTAPSDIVFTYTVSVPMRVLGKADFTSVEVELAQDRINPSE